MLRSLQVESLVLTGIATSGVVLSTLRQAADLDHGLTVLREGCADRDDEVHRVVLDKVSLDTRRCSPSTNGSRPSPRNGWPVPEPPAKRADPRS